LWDPIYVDVSGTEITVDNKPLLITGSAASRLLGIDRNTFRRLAQAEGLSTVSTGRSKMFKRMEVERLAGIGEGASA
jgi:hypothetical protein